MNIPALSQQISQAVGTVQNGFLSNEQLAQAYAVIDTCVTEQTSSADRLGYAMIKAFLCLPFDDGSIDAALNHFMEGRYTISNDNVDLNGKAPTSDSKLNAGKLPSDIWSIGQLVTDSLSSEADYESVADRTGKQMAMLVYGCEKVVNYHSHPFDILEQEFTRYSIAPFNKIRLFEFAGLQQSTLANQRRGVAKLLGDFRLHLGAGEAKARRDFTGFVSATSAPSIPPRNYGSNCIIVRNILHRNAVENDIDPYDNVVNLLCAFANALPDGGRLYVSASKSDPIDVRNIPELLAYTGFKPVGNTSYCHEGQTPSYILERDFAIKNPNIIRPAGFRPTTLLEQSQRNAEESDGRIV